MEIVRLLPDRGADVNKKAIIDNVEYTAVGFGRKARHRDILEILCPGSETSDLLNLIFGLYYPTIKISRERTLDD